MNEAQRQPPWFNALFTCTRNEKPAFRSLRILRLLAAIFFDAFSWRQS
jgi:hypothetical protein